MRLNEWSAFAERASLLALFLAVTAAPAAGANLTSSVTLITTPNPSYQGESVAMTVHAFEPAQSLTTTPPIATGAVSISVTCPGNSSGIPDATYSGVLDATGVWTTANSVWPCTGSLILQAAYPGDTNFLPGASRQLIQTVNATRTPVALSFVPAPFTFTAGTAFNLGVDFTYTLANLTRPSGTVTFTNTSVAPPTTVSAPIVVASGTKTITSATSQWTLSSGTYTIEAYYPGDGNYAPATAFVNVVVNGSLPSATGTALIASASTINFGQPVTFTATVTSPAGGSPVGASGSVDFYANGVSLGTVPVDLNGQSALTTAALATGSNTVTAQYLGAANYQQSTSPAVIVLVQTPSTTTTVTSSSNPATAGIPFQLISTVAPASAAGTVTFSATPPLPPAAGTPVPLLLVGGIPTAVLSVTLPAGAYTVTASFTPTNPTAFSPSLSAPYPVVVNQPAAAVTQTSINSSANPSVYGQPVTFSMTVIGSPTSGVPTGQIGLTAGPITTPALTLDSAGQATFTTGALPVGSNNVVAVYQGDSLNQGSTSPTLVQGVTRAATTTALITSVNPATYGQAVTFTAAVAVNAPGAGIPTGAVTFLDGTTTLGSAALSGGTATFGTAGLPIATHSITAAYGGDGNFGGSTSPVLLQSVSQDSTTTTLVSSTNPSVYGQSLTFTATVATNVSGAGVPTGSVTFLDGSTSLGIAPLSGGIAILRTAGLSAATHSITATYGGNGSLSGSTSPALLQSVNQDSTTTTLVSSANPSAYGQSVRFTATVAANAPGAGVPTGLVTFLSDATTLGTAPLTGGAASYSTAGLTPATHSITAVYGGDGNFTRSTSSAVSQITNKAATITSLRSSLNPAATGQAVTVTASVAVLAPGAGIPAGTVGFASGGTTLNVALSPAGTATWTTSALPAGTDTIMATYSGSADFQGSSATLNQTETTVPPPPPPPASADLSIVKTVDEQSVSPGGREMYRVRVANRGPGAASLVVVTDVLPPGAVFQSLQFDWQDGYSVSCTTPAIGQPGAVVCKRASLRANTSFLINVLVKITAPVGAVITNTATVSSSTSDPNLANNTSSVKVFVQADN